MKSANSIQLLTGIDRAITDIKSFNVSPGPSSTYLAHFLIVYICGIYEEIIESTVLEMVKKTNNVEIINFVKNSLSFSFQNPNAKKINDLFKKFDNSYWSDQIRQIPDSNKLALNSIVENKNALAHGTSSLALTIADVEDYYIRSRVIIEKIDDLLL